MGALEGCGQSGGPDSEQGGLTECKQGCCCGEDRPGGERRAGDQDGGEYPGQVLMGAALGWEWCG